MQKFHAFTSTAEITSRIEKIPKKLADYSFGKIKKIVIIQAIFAAADEQDIYKVNVEDFIKKNTPLLSNILDKCEFSLPKAAQFLYEDIHVPGDNCCPIKYNWFCLVNFSDYVHLLTNNKSGDCTHGFG